MSTIGTGTAAFYNRSRSQLGDLRQRAEQLQLQMSSGERLNESSDDPVAASRLRLLQRQERLAKVDTRNSDRARTDLTLAADSLADMAETMTRVRELTMSAANDITSASAREAIAEEIAQLRQRLLGTMNARDSAGHALFGGEITGDAYTLDANGDAVYAGTAQSVQIDLGDGQSVTRGMIGPEFINFTSGGTSTDLLAVTKALAEALDGGSADPAQAAQDALQSIEDGLDSVTRAQTLLGTRLAWIDVVDDRRTLRSETRSEEQLSVGGAEITDTVAQLQQMLLVLDASQASFTKLASMSLFNQI
jgi:flagellar hook-associated protein 3 FlgL